MEVLWVTQAEYLYNYRVLLVFNDGTKGEFDFAELVASDKHFAPLHDPSVFQQFKLDGWTLSWLDGRVDIAPEYLYEHIVTSGAPSDIAAEPDLQWHPTPHPSEV